MSNLPPTLYSLVINLMAENEGNLPQTHGKLIHGAFYNIIQTIHPQLSAEIHKAEEKTPFTLSPLRGVGRPRNGRFKIRTGQTCWLRITLFGDKLLQDFLSYFTQGRVNLKIGSISFALQEIHTSPTGHKLAQTCNLVALSAQWQTTKLEGHHHKIDLRFYSPTAFSLRDKHTDHRHIYLFPDTAAVFGELAGYWDNFLGTETQDDVRLFAAQHILVGRYELKTHILDFRDFKQIGFMGTVQYEIKGNHNPELTRLINALADLAFFTGIGSRTGMGMGQIQRIED